MISVLSLVISVIWVVRNLSKLPRAHLGVCICILGAVWSMILVTPDVVFVNFSSPFYVFQVTAVVLEVFFNTPRTASTSRTFPVSDSEPWYTASTLSYTQLTVALLLWFLTIDLKRATVSCVEQGGGLANVLDQPWAILQNFLVLLLTKLLLRRELTIVESYFYAP